MKARIEVLVLVVLFGGSISFRLPQPTPRAPAGNGGPHRRAANLAFADDEPRYAYVGSFRCKKCHLSEYKSWEPTRMAHSFEILKPSGHKEAKEKFKIDVNKDYTKDATCLECHTTGFGISGGYAVPAEDEKAVRKAAQLAGVGCESCQGPGSEYVEVLEEIMKSKRKYKAEKLYAVGLTKSGEATCKTCHNEEGPTYDSAARFDYAKRKREGLHALQPLKQREE